MKSTERKQQRLPKLMRATFAMSVIILWVVMSSSGSRLTFTVSGVVTNAQKLPLSGVNVVEKGTLNGTVTDLNGRYTLQVSNSHAVLSFSFVGFVTQEAKINGKPTLYISLAEDVMALQEMVVTGHSNYAIKKAGAIHQRGRAVYTMDSEAMPVFMNPSIEEYARINETGFRTVTASPLSTFSVDVDRASYSNVRRFINNGQRPPGDAVRIEEMINYFSYDYPQPKNHPFTISTTYTDCPWQEKHKILHIGLQGREIPTDKLPPSNLVFLIDVSGSMNMPNRLPLVKSSFRLLVNKLRENDRLALVVYSGAAGLVLPSTGGEQKEKIIAALDQLEAGGSTAGAAGIKLAYQIATENFIRGGNNRVIIATDGDFNVGVSGTNELEQLIVKHRNTGVFLTCLGYGMGNYKDAKLETLANKGNGNYAYINDIQEANKVLINEFGGTLFTIAKDVKLQIEFNPAHVQAYRLVGYENRMLQTEDFKDDKKDAGEVGSGHTVTAIYEIIPTGIKSNFVREVDDLKYQLEKPSGVKRIAVLSAELVNLKIRYKAPDGDVSSEMSKAVKAQAISIEEAGDNVGFSAAVAMFGMLLRDSEFKGMATGNQVVWLAEASRGNDKEGYRAEFIRLVKASGDNLLGRKE